jgi:hypothetical protein
MRTQPNQTAYLPNPIGANLPPVSLPIEARFQLAVNCGAESATAFFNNHPEITLHTHLPVSLDYFLSQAKQGAAALGVDWQGVDKQVTDAFLAGYLGRIQQELRIIQTPDKPRPLAVMH